jgi:hypothetical protein
LEETPEDGRAAKQDVIFAAEPDEEPELDKAAERPISPPADDGGPRVGRLISPGIPSGNEFGVVKFNSAHRIIDPDIELKPDPPRRPVSPFKRIGVTAPEGAQVYASAHLGPHGELAVVGIPMPTPSLSPLLTSVRTAPALRRDIPVPESQTFEGDEGEADQEPAEAAPGATGPRRRPRRRGRGRSGKPAGNGGAGAAPLTEARPEPEEDLNDSIGNLKPAEKSPLSESEAAGSPAAAPRRRRGGRGRGRSRSASTGSRSDAV